MMVETKADASPEAVAKTAAEIVAELKVDFGAHKHRRDLALNIALWDENGAVVEDCTYAHRTYAPSDLFTLIDGYETLAADRDRLVKAAVEVERESCAKIADTGMLAPPDGGSPTDGECDVALGIAAAIRSRSSAPPVNGDGK